MEKLEVVGEQKNQVNKALNPDKINRYVYIAFIGLCIYYVFKKDFMSAASNLGIALIFDPFDTTVMWNNRPTYQKVWMIVHLLLVFGLFGLGFGLSFGFKF